MADRPNIKLISLDLDGTALDFDDQHSWLADPLVDVLNGLGRHGVYWCCNSGRHYQNQLGIVQACRGLENMPVAVCAGERFIYWTKPHTHAHEPFNSEMHDRLAKLHPQVCAAVEPHRSRVLREYPIIREYDRDGIVGWQLADESRAPELVADYKRILSEVPDAQVLRNREWVVSNHILAGKGVLLTEVALKFGIDRSSILAIGDHMNDIDMLDGRVAGFVGCPADSGDELKSVVRTAGGLVSALDHTAGTVDIIRRICI